MVNNILQPEDVMSQPSTSREPFVRSPTPHCSLQVPTVGDAYLFFTHPFSTLNTGPPHRPEYVALPRKSYPVGTSTCTRILSSYITFCSMESASFMSCIVRASTVAASIQSYCDNTSTENREKVASIHHYSTYFTYRVNPHSFFHPRAYGKKMSVPCNGYASIGFCGNSDSDVRTQQWTCYVGTVRGIWVFVR
jgi:hypothetical protein